MLGVSQRLGAHWWSYGAEPRGAAVCSQPGIAPSASLFHLITPLAGLAGEGNRIRALPSMFWFLFLAAPMPSDVLSTPGSVNTTVQDEQSGLTSQYEDPDQPQDSQDTVVTLPVEMPTDAAPTGSNRSQRCLGECRASAQLGFELSSCCCSTCGGEPRAKEEGNGVEGCP